jgi:predicted nucleic acid-binding protein
VKPVSGGHREIADRYIGFFRRPGVIVLPFDLEAASRYASIRQDRTITRSDAMQLATAASAGIDLFITNDGRLSKVVVAGIAFVSSLNRAPI